MVTIMSKVKSYSKEFKFKVALEMVKGDLSTAEIVSKYQVPHSVVARWKKELLEKGATLFDRNKAGSSNANGNEVELEKLYATIGKLKVENNFLQAVSAKLKL